MFVAGLTLILIEQIPERIDRVVDAGLYLAPGGVALLLLLADMAGDALRILLLPEPLTLPVIGFGILGLVLIEAGRCRQARYLRAHETVHLRVELSQWNPQFQYPPSRMAVH